MLHQARNRAVARGALLLGAILSLTGTAGLHVHDGPCLATVVSRSAAGTVQQGDELHPTESHACPVCLLYGATHVATVTALAGDLRPVALRSPAVLVQPPACAAVGPSPSRAPPLAS